MKKNGKLGAGAPGGGKRLLAGRRCFWCGKEGGTCSSGGGTLVRMKDIRDMRHEVMMLVLWRVDPALALRALIHMSRYER